MGATNAVVQVNAMIYVSDREKARRCSCVPPFGARWEGRKEWMIAMELRQLKERVGSDQEHHASLGPGSYCP